MTRKAVNLALEGDTTALRLCLERLCPPRKDRPVSFDLPPMKAPADAVAAMSALLAAVAQGEPSIPCDGRALHERCHDLYFGFERQDHLQGPD